MYNDLILRNEEGAELHIGAAGPFLLSDISGIDPPPGIINTSAAALMDGARYNSSKLDTRAINIAFAIQGPAAANRVTVYSVIRSAQKIRMIYRGQYRDVYIDGYVQDVNITMMANKQICTVQILCPEPYFLGASEEVDLLTQVEKRFRFPFHSTEDPQIVLGVLTNELGITIENAGDLQCGMVIELYAAAAVEDPKIFNYITREYFGLIYAMQAADLITIDTRPGKKSVTLTRAGVTTNIINFVEQGSTWLQLEPAGSTFVYEVGEGSATNLTVTFRHTDLYEGV